MTATDRSVATIAVRGSLEPTLEAVRQAAEQVVGQPLAAAEAIRIARYCTRNELDPYEDVSFVRTKSGVVPIVTRAAWLRRVARDAAFAGLESGVLVVNTAAADGAGPQIGELPGAFVPPGHKLVGAWARIHRRDRTVPTYCRVSAAEYADKAAQPGSAWAKYPATMLVKVAIVHACREAFPDLGGAYDESEFPAAVVISHQADATTTGDGVIPPTPNEDGEKN
jgi:phage recombination protein Bet